MTTKWSVTSATDHVAMDAANAGEVTFTVTNQSVAPEHVVFDVTPAAGAHRSWFTVEEPQRLVAAYASVQFLVRVKVPAGTSTGAYSFRGVAYSADRAQDDSSGTSGDVAFDVAGTRASKTVWRLTVAAAIVLVVVVLLAFCQRRWS